MTQTRSQQKRFLLRLIFPAGGSRIITVKASNATVAQRRGLKRHPAAVSVGLADAE